MLRHNGIAWLFLDLNSYFASVEQQEQPHLRGRPTAVIPSPTDSTCAIAASYEAKAFGVKTGTKIYEAKRICPDLQCVLARHDKYVEYHHRIISEIIKHTPINKVWSIDELDSFLTPKHRDIEAAKDLAIRIKNGIRKNVGEAIGCSIGLAPNSLLAKIATDMQKPDGLVVIRQEDLPGPLLDLKLTEIPGIGVNMERRLLRAGIGSIAQLWQVNPKHLRKIWGGVQGERFWYRLHGYDIPHTETNRVMIGHSRMLDPNLRTSNQARLMARRLLTKATYRLRHENYYAKTISLGVRALDGPQWRKEATFPAANDPFTAMQHLENLWNEMLDTFLIHMPTARLLKVSVIFHGLCKKEEITRDLFTLHDQSNAKTLKKNQALTGALDHLQKKYKKEAVSVGIPPKTRAGHVGTKIAFSRVPEQEEFWS